MYDTLSVADIKVNNKIVVASIYNHVEGKSQLIKSDNFGANWVFCNNGIDSNSEVILLRLNENLIIGFSIYGTFYFSSDNGNNWISDKFFIFNNLQINDVNIFNDLVFVSTNFGLFYRNINKNNWNEFERFKGIECGILNYNNDYYISTGNGIFVFNIKGQIVDSIKSYPYENDLFLNSIEFIQDKTIISSDSGIFYTTNQGDIWVDITLNQFFPVSEYDGIMKLSTYENKLYSISKEGVYYLDECKNIWVKCIIISKEYIGRTNWTFSSISEIVFIGSQQYGIYTSVDGFLFIPLITSYKSIDNN